MPEAANEVEELSKFNRIAEINGLPKKLNF
jgi:hypothetical protein